MSNENKVGMVSFFEMFEDSKDIKEFNAEQEKIKVESKTDKTKGTKNTKKDESKTKASKPVVDPNKKIEDDCAKCEKVVVKVFGHPVFVLEEEEEIKSIKMENMLKRIIQSGFDEFTTIKVSWNLALSEDKKIGYLIPTYSNFFAKG